MLPEDHPIPVSIVKLLIGFFMRNNSEEGNELLDDWICKAEINMKAFEECLEETLLP